MPARQVVLLQAAAALLLACGLAEAALKPDRNQQPFQVVPGRVLVKTNPRFVSAMDVNRQGLRFARPAGNQGAAVYTITDGKSVEEKIAEMAQNPAIEYAEPDYRVPVNWEPNDSLFGVEWHHAMVSSSAAWDATTGVPAVKVCHIDSGVRVDHPDLQGRVFKGWNLVPEVQDFDQEPPPPGSAQYKNINDSYGHGTHTAGIIAAVGNNGLGVAGMAMDVRLLVCRFIWDDGFGSISDALECLRLCKAEGAHISSNSWGGVPFSRAIEEGLKEVDEAGMLFVVASGNQGIDLDERPSYPASAGKTMDSILVVGSSGRADGVSDFSNIGRQTVHLLAPGEQILSTTYNNWYGPMDGTSMACPLVAGAAALLQSAALSQGVVLSHAEMRNLLLSSVDPSPADAAGATTTGGRLNAAAAMGALALMLNQRTGQVLPGGWLEGDKAEVVRQKLLGSQAGQALLASAESSAAPAPTEGQAYGAVAAAAAAQTSSPTLEDGPQRAAAGAARVGVQALPAGTIAARQPVQGGRAQRRQRRMRPGAARQQL